MNPIASHKERQDGLRLRKLPSSLWGQSLHVGGDVYQRTFAQLHMKIAPKCDFKHYNRYFWLYTITHSNVWITSYSQMHGGDLKKKKPQS
jgi:hypothetical protein